MFPASPPHRAIPRTERRERCRGSPSTIPTARRAAALACAMKEDRGFVPDLIGTLEDKDGWVVRAAATVWKASLGRREKPLNRS